MKKTGRNLRVGVIGVGTMGQHHVRIVSQSPGVSLVGFHDPDASRSAEICLRHGCECFDTVEALLDKSDAVSVAAPTSLHLRIGEECLARGIHVLMEKPLADSIEAASRLVELARRTGVVLAVGHIEAHNPAVAALMEMLQREPEEIVSIDARRLAPFDGSRCLDVDVLYDLLVHDVDLALCIANSPAIRVSAAGRPVFSKQIDVAHARIEFENGAIAVFWTAKCSPRKVRSLTVTTPRRFLVADTLSSSLTVYISEQLPAMADGVCLMGEIRREEVPVPDEEPLRREFADFFSAIREGTRPLVDGDRALNALHALGMIAASIAEGGREIQGH